MKWEVRTMRSVTSCSKTLRRSDWRRFWPVTFLYAFFSFFALPIAIWNEGRFARPEEGTAAFHYATVMYEVLPGFTVMSLLLGLGLAMVLFGYLMRANSVGLMHALPISRGRQFGAHFAAGMSMLTAANLLTFALAALMEAVLGGVDLVHLLIWLLVAELTGFFYFAFGTLCAMATGWLLAVPVIYFGLNFMVFAYRIILAGVAHILYVGYDGGYFPSSRVVEWLTPTVKLGRVMSDSAPSWQEYKAGATLFTLNREALVAVLVYTLAGGLMLIFAWILYRARHSETAGDAIVFPWLRPVVKYVISIAAGLGLGTIVHQIVSGGRDVVGLILCMLIMGGLVYCAVEMLLRKSYRIFDRRMTIGLAALWLVLIAVCVGIKLDVTGYQRRVPQPQQVAEVYISGAGIYGVESDDPKVIGAVVDLHRLLVRNGDDTDGVYFHISYGLANGDVLVRSYDIDLQDPEIYQALSKLLNMPEVRYAALLVDWGEYGQKFTGGYAWNYATGQETELTPEQCLALYRALEKDAEAPVKPEALWREMVYIHLDLWTEEGSYSIDSLRADCANTLALLEEYGLMDGLEE